MSAALTPERLSFCRMCRGWWKWSSLDLILAADSGDVTQAMNLFGRRIGAWESVEEGGIPSFSFL